MDFGLQNSQIKYLNWFLDRRLDSWFVLFYFNICSCHFDCQFKVFKIDFPIESYRIKIAII